MGASIETYIPASMADDLRKLGITRTATTQAIQATLRKLIADKKAHIAWAEAGCPETPAEETPSLKELLNISHDEGTMSFLATVESKFSAPTVEEGVKKAVEAVRKVFGPEAVLQPTLSPHSLSMFNTYVQGTVDVKVYTL